MDSWLSHILQVLLAGVALLVVTAMLLTGAWATGIVGFHYPHIIPDEPLTSPVSVLRVKGDLLYLANDRVVKMDHYQGEMLEAIIAESGNAVELHGEDSEMDVTVYSRQYGSVSCEPWAQPIRIPLIRDDVYVNRVNLLGFGAYVVPPTSMDSAPVD